MHASPQRGITFEVTECLLADDDNERPGTINEFLKPAALRLHLRDVSGAMIEDHRHDHAVLGRELEHHLCFAQIGDTDHLRDRRLSRFAQKTAGLECKSDRIAHGLASDSRSVR